jgi:hypothetical protein
VQVRWAWPSVVYANAARLPTLQVHYANNMVSLVEADLRVGNIPCAVERIGTSTSALVGDSDPNPWVFEV